MARSAPAGWEAFACDAISEVPHKNGTYELNGLLGDVRLKIFVQVSGLQLRAPYYVRTLEGDQYTLSTFQLRDGILTDFEFPGFKFLSQVVPLMESRPRKTYRRASERRSRRLQSPSPPVATRFARMAESPKTTSKRAQSKSVSLKDESLALLQALRNQIIKKA